MRISKKLLLLLTSLTLTIIAMGAVFSFPLSANLSLGQAYDTPMRLVLSYDNHQLKDESGPIDPCTVVTERGTELTIYQDGVSYHDNRIYVAEDGLFGNVTETGIQHSPINGMYQMTFTDFGNVSVMVGSSKNKTCAGSDIYEPDENGVITFATPRPSYYKVAPLDVSKPMYFHSFAIDFTCIEDPGYVVESKTASVGQSYYGEGPVSYTYTDYFDNEKGARRPDHFIYIENHSTRGIFDPEYEHYNTVADSIDLHNIVVDVEFKASVDGQTTYRGIRLDDPYVSNLSIHLDDEDLHDIIHPGIESDITFDFTYRDYGHVTAHAKAFAYYTKTVTYRFAHADNVRIQDNDLDMPDFNVYLYTYVYLNGYHTNKGNAGPNHTVGIACFTRTLKFSELNDLTLDSHPFSATGDHEFTFRLETGALQSGTYHVYDGTCYQAMVGFNMPTELEVGTNLESYIESREIGASFFYYDGDFEYVQFQYEDFDFSKVDSNSEGLFTYTVRYKDYAPIKQFISFVLTDIGEDEGFNTLYSTTGTDYPVVLGFDENGSYGPLYIKELLTCANGYRATVASAYSEEDFYRTGTYERINDNTLLLSGQLGGVRVYASTYPTKIAPSETMYNSIESTEYTATGYGLLANCKIHILETDYREMMIEFGDYQVRTRFSYLDSLKTAIAFKFPLPLTSSFINLTATIQGNTIHVNDPGFSA